MYVQGDTVRLVDGRVARIVRVFPGQPRLYDVRLYDGAHDRIDVRHDEIAGYVRRVTVWMDDPTKLPATQEPPPI